MDVGAIEGTFGVLSAGITVAIFMYGITCLQTYFYYLYFTKDKRSLRIFVALIWLLDTAHIVTVCHTMFYYLVTCFGHPELLEEGVWSLFTSIALNVITAFIVQIFFTERIFRLSPPRTRWWFSALVAITVVAHFGFGIATVIQFFHLGRFDKLHSTAAVPVIFAVTAILSDILVAGALCALFDGSRTGIRTTDGILNRLIVYAVNRCVLTSAIAIGEVICFRLLPLPFWAFALDVIIGKLYTNSLLASLNARHMSSQHSKDVNTLELSSVLPTNTDSSGSGSRFPDDQYASSAKEVKTFRMVPI
jgi:hypothetical protein